MRLYLRPKFDVSSIYASFRHGGNFTPIHPVPQNEPLKSPPRLGLRDYKDYLNFNLKVGE